MSRDSCFTDPRIIHKSLHCTLSITSRCVSRAQESLQRTHFEMFASSDLVLLSVMEAICMQNIAGVVVTKVENCSGGTDIDNCIEGQDTQSHCLSIVNF